MTLTTDCGFQKIVSHLCTCIEDVEDNDINKIHTNTTQANYMAITKAELAIWRALG